MDEQEPLRNSADPNETRLLEITEPMPPKAVPPNLDCRVDSGFEKRPQVQDLIIEQMSTFLAAGSLQDASRVILSHALKPTESEFGFVGLILKGGLLRLLVHEGLKWHETTNREFYDTKMRSYAENGYLDFHESGNLISAVVSGKKVVLTNSPATDPRSRGVPAGHPALHCFLGVPAIKGDEVVGMIGVANRPGGYAQTEQLLLEMLIPGLTVLYDWYCRSNLSDN